jgi:alpha(1,3/1,4) fucosyltransferase
MPEKLRVQCCDFAPRHQYDSYIFRVLGKAYDLEISDDPEIVLYGPFGSEFLKYRCLRIYYTGENTRPNFKHCDYAFSFEYSADPRNYRFPDYASYRDVNLLTRPKDVDAIVKSRTGFCSFTVSNPISQPRIRFFRLLSRYKRVDSFGRVLNNMPATTPTGTSDGGWQDTKLGLTESYKFAIAFENASRPGYVTEKIMHAMLCNSIPIYWGSPQIGEDFNTKAFVSCHDYRSFQEVAQRVIEIDNDERLYRQMLAEPWYVDNRVPENVTEESVMRRLKTIVEQRHTIVPVAQRNPRRSQTAWERFRSRLREELRGRQYAFYAGRYIK